MMSTLFFISCVVSQVQSEQLVLDSFGTGVLQQSLSPWRASNKLVSYDSAYALEVQFSYPGWSCAAFKAPDAELWDWSAWDGLDVELFNPNPEPIIVNTSVESAKEDGSSSSIWAGCVVPAKAKNTVHVRFDRKTPGDLWGMRYLPQGHIVTMGGPINKSRIKQYTVFPVWVETPTTLLVTGIRLVRGASVSERPLQLPFVDQFGQYMGADWPGKLKSEEELKERARAEEQQWTSIQRISGTDELGGWADGPQLEATGWFRTARVDGKWWLVTPQGRLFFSLGVAALNLHHTATFVDGRPSWFEGLPDPKGPFKPCFEETSFTHSMADAIGGKGRAFYFLRANLYRKYGDSWEENFRNSVFHRLRTWGFNTIGNWASHDLYERSQMPFAISIWPGNGTGFRRVEGGGGYWWKMPDPFDPAWEQASEKSVQEATEQSGFVKNPLCIGYTVDNELAWEQVAPGVLPSPPDQPCRMVFIEQLKEKYKSLDDLNKAWDTSAASWDVLRNPMQPNDACKSDLDAFVYTFAKKYFGTLSQLLRKYAPNQLYMGCRFAYGDFTHPEAERACAEICDVMTYNCYRRQIDPSKGNGPEDRGKPVLITEFSFGATDRGLFYPGFIATNDQADRGQHYIEYVRSLAGFSHFVGCHWYMYRDAPVSGGTFDGDGSNYGLVDVTDTPYPELLQAARKAHEEVYLWHNNAK